MALLVCLAVWHCHLCATDSNKKALRQTGIQRRVRGVPRYATSKIEIASLIAGIHRRAGVDVPPPPHSIVGPMQPRVSG